MEKLSIKDLYKDFKSFSDKEVCIEGWVRTVRDSKTFGFIELNDGSFFKNVQIVISDILDNFKDLVKLTISSSIKVSGTLVVTENSKQPFEIQAKNIEVLNLSDVDYPLQKKRHTFEYLRTVAHLRPRTNTFNAIFRIRSVAEEVLLLLQYMNISKIMDMYMFILQLLHVQIVKVQQKCLNLQLWT